MKDRPPSGSVDCFLITRMIFQSWKVCSFNRPDRQRCPMAKGPSDTYHAKAEAHRNVPAPSANKGKRERSNASMSSANICLKTVCSEHHGIDFGTSSDAQCATAQRAVTLAVKSGAGLGGQRSKLVRTLAVRVQRLDNSRSCRDSGGSKGTASTQSKRGAASMEEEILCYRARVAPSRMTETHPSSTGSISFTYVYNPSRQWASSY